MQPQDQNQPPLEQPSQPQPPQPPVQSQPEPQPSYQYPAAPTAPSEPAQEVNNPLATMRPGEQVICEIKRHPIGMLGIYIGAILFVLLIAAIGFIIVPLALTDYPKSRIYGFSLLVVVVTAVICALFTWISHVVYWGNRWIVTDDSLTQVLQISLFNKQNSQLSMANLEDVTVEKNGILAQMFNYGVLKAETAGEHSKFRFPYCPNPNHYAQQILQAREAFEQENYRQPRV